MANYSDRPPSMGEIFSVVKVLIKEIRSLVKPLTREEKEEVKEVTSMANERISQGKKFQEDIEKYYKKYKDLSDDEIEKIIQKLKQHPKRITGSNYTDEKAQYEAIRKILREK